MNEVGVTTENGTWDAICEPGKLQMDITFLQKWQTDITFGQKWRMDITRASSSRPTYAWTSFPAVSQNEKKWSTTTAQAPN